MANPLKSLFGISELEAEKSRLEAFLAAFPGQYCGFSKDNIIAYSASFPETLGLKSIRGLSDIQHALRPGDDAALESCFAKLQSQGTRFSLKLRSAADDRIFKVTGSKGQDFLGSESYDILWLEDVTEGENYIEWARDDAVKKDRDIKSLRATLDTFENPVWIHDANGRLVWVNLSYAAITGQSAEEVVLHQKELNFTKKATGKTLFEMARDCLSDGTTQKDARHIINKGDRRLFNIQIKPVTHLDLIVGEAKDITHEEEIEKESLRKDAANRELLEHLSTAIAVYNTDFRLEFYNTSYAQLWQLEEQWLNGKPKLVEVIERLREARLLPEQADFRVYKQNLLNTFSRLIGPYEEMLYLPNGRALRLVAMPRPQGGVLLTFEDVTSRLELESSYNTLIAVQKETLDNLAEGVAAFGGDGRLKLWNPSFARLWALNPEDMEGMPHVTKLVEKFNDFFDASSWPRARDNILSQALDRNMRDGILTRSDDTVLEFAAVPLPDGGMLVTHSDITDTIRVENALREKTSALETAERLKLEFLANVSYQLRTPLNAIIGFTEILDKEYFGSLNTRQKEYTRGLGEAGERLMNLINDILDLSSIEAGYMTLEKGSIDICNVLQDITNLTQEWARSQRIEVELSCNKETGKIIADERRIKQVLLNLIRNAIEFTPPGGRIILSAEKDREDVLIRVKDTGSGIPQEDLERVFKPFEKAESAREEEESKRGGAGLGLTLVKNIIELHGGEISIDSQIDKGTTVSIRLH